MEVAKIRYKKSLSETLKGLPIGETRMISGKDWEKQMVRNRCAILKRREGLNFEVSSPTGCVDSVVTRLK